MQPRVYSYIRFSTPEQALGDSLRRQTEAARKYAKDRGLPFDENTNITDKGLSGFKGKNVENGGLGQFLKAVAASKIPKGSVLVMEEIDRLTRIEPLDAIALMRQIVNSGVKIVTTADGMEYSRESFATNQMALMTFVLKSQLGHDESKKKSMRIKAAWEGKRQKLDAGEIKQLTTRAPAWLEYDKAKGRFKPIPQRKKVLEEIFKWASQGVGQTTITKRLNQRNEPVWGRANGWHSSYVQKILGNRSVIGEFQPHKMVDGKRVPEGEPIANYFPVAIKPTLFKKADAKRKSLASVKGKRPTTTKNLFPRIAFSGYTGATAVFVDKGKPPKGGMYLVSDSARRSLGEPYKAWRYKHFEDAFFAFITKLDFQQVFNETLNSDGLDQLRLLEAKTSVEAERLQSAVGNLINGVEQGGAGIKLLVSKLKERDSQLEESRRLLEEIQAQISAAESKSKTFVHDGQALQKLFERKDDEEVRLRLRNAIQDQIERIDIFFHGFDFDKVGDWIVDKVRQAGDFFMLTEEFKNHPAAIFLHHSGYDYLREEPMNIDEIASRTCKDERRREEFVRTEVRAKFHNRYRPFFTVEFVNGAKRLVMPDPKTPTENCFVVDWSNNMVLMYSWNDEADIEGKRKPVKETKKTAPPKSKSSAGRKAKPKKRKSNRKKN
jgi:DNA invertase Pin-like site-specific DNA recombinase